MGLKWVYHRGHGLLSCQEFDSSLPSFPHLGLLWPLFLPLVPARAGHLGLASCTAPGVHLDGTTPPRRLAPRVYLASFTSGTGSGSGNEAKPWPGDPAHHHTSYLPHLLPPSFLKMPLGGTTARLLLVGG